MTDLGDDDAGLAQWRADNWTGIKAVWSGLMPESKAAPCFGTQELTPAQAGVVFGRLMTEALRLGGLSGHHAFTVSIGDEDARIREEIDGLVMDRWQGFLVEAKYWRDGVDFGPIARLHVLASQRPEGTLGLFFSAFGFTLAARASAQLLRPMRVLLFDGLDLAFALRKAQNVREAIQRKWKLALKHGRPNIRISEYDPQDEF